jgi:hypothetical protein
MKRTSNKVNYEIPTALYFYATGRLPMAAKLKTLEPSAPPAIDPANPKNFTMARIIFGGNFDPEPAAWPRFARQLNDAGATSPALPDGTGPRLPIASNQRLLTVANVAIKDLNPQKYPVAHMTGTAKFLIKPEEVDALRRYLDAGGTLIADAAGGSDAFAAEFLRMAQLIYPNTQPASLPPDHPIFTGKFTDHSFGNGEKATEINFRKYGSLALHQQISTASLQAFTVNGRARIIFSPYDITSGLLGTNTWGIIGYAPDSARTLAGNLVRYAAQSAAAQTTQPK